MEEQLVSFETAKLAKEVGFDELSNGYYQSKEILYKDNILTRNGMLARTCCATPTQSLLQKWLRDKKIHIEAIPIDSWGSWGYNILMEDVMSPFFVAGYNSIEYKTYEEALEAGLLNALKLI